MVENKGEGFLKSFVKLHGGIIQVESQEGIRTKFIIDLPVSAGIENLEVEEESVQYCPNVERINIEFSDIYSI